MRPCQVRRTSERNLAGRQVVDFIGAGDGIRTHDPNLGKNAGLRQAVVFRSKEPCLSARCSGFGQGDEVQPGSVNLGAQYISPL